MAFSPTLKLLVALIAVMLVIALNSISSLRNSLPSTDEGKTPLELVLLNKIGNRNQVDSSDFSSSIPQQTMGNEDKEGPQQQRIRRANGTREYQPTWPSLDSRPLPVWYDQSKVGVFITWGIYSVPGLTGEWFWEFWRGGNKEVTKYMEENFKPNATYQEFAPQFTAEFFEPQKWAELFKKSGAKYVVLTSKHHEGYTLWPSRFSFSWNAQDVGPHRDLVGDLAAAVRNTTGLKFGLYHSLYEWFNPLWLYDKQNNHITNEFVRFKMLPEMYELVNAYKPEIFWSDGDWEATDTYWQSKEFLAWLYNQSPVKNQVVVNDRWGQGIPCKHGGYFTCTDRYNPGVLQPRKWENCMTLDKDSWGYRRNAKIEDFLTPAQLMTTIVESVACGGNVLVNVGPTREGIIPPIQEKRLLQMGEWLGINGEAIYGTVPFSAQNDAVTPGVWYTMSADKTKVFGMITKWPGYSLTLGLIDNRDFPQLAVNMLGYNKTLFWTKAGGGKGIVVNLPHRDEIASSWVWTLVFNK